ncbi:MAG: hypothetical protein HC824_07685 [Synechococcales cyanobacterium RM1_1_8]|nr:hypothetical protein [Synechococcales cyanobacterium RM1_1_8]
MEIFVTFLPPSPHFDHGYGIIELNDEDEERLGRMVVSAALENLVSVPSAPSQAA